MADSLNYPTYSSLSHHCTVAAARRAARVGLRPTATGLESAYVRRLQVSRRPTSDGYSSRVVFTLLFAVIVQLGRHDSVHSCAADSEQAGRLGDIPLAVIDRTTH